MLLKNTSCLRLGFELGDFELYHVSCVWSMKHVKLVWTHGHSVDSPKTLDLTNFTNKIAWHHLKRKPTKTSTFSGENHEFIIKTRMKNHPHPPQNISNFRKSSEFWGLPWLSHGFPMAFTSAMCFSGRAGRRDAAAPAAGHVAGQGAGAAAVPVAQLELGKRRWENAGILGDSYGIMAWFMGLLWVWDYFGNYSWNYWDILGLWILWDMNIGYWDIVLVVLHHGYFFWDAGNPIGSLWCESIIGESVNIHLWWYYWITMGLLWDYYGMIYGVHYGIIKQSSFITIMSPYFLGFWDYSRNYLGNYVWNYDYSHIIIGITVVIIIPHDFLGWWDYGTMMGIH